jgi:hypothetical protein
VLSGSWGPSFLYGNGDACTAYRCGMNGWEGEMNIHERGSLVRQLLFFFSCTSWIGLFLLSFLPFDSLALSCASVFVA